MADERNHIHIPFHQQHTLEVFRLAQQVGRVNVMAFVKRRRVGRVEGFGLYVAQRPAAEAEHRTARVDDRKHRAVAEHIEGTVIFFLHRQPGLCEQINRRALLLQMLCQRIPAVRGSADSKQANRSIVQPAAVQIGKRLRALGRIQRLMVKHRRLAVEAEDVFTQRTPLLFPAVVRRIRKRHVELVRQIAHGFRKFHALHAHDEIENRSARLASEAIV